MSLDAREIERRVLALERPHENLLFYYLLLSLVLVPIFPILFTIGYLRYRTLRYTFDEEGVSMRWGLLFRREISLTYSRIQDIHLASNAVERWLGLARVQVQTASGAAKAEMTIEGLQEFELVRDFLYSRMRGAAPKKSPTTSHVAAAPGDQELVVVLGEVTEELRRLRHLIEERGVGPVEAPAEEGS